MRALLALMLFWAAVSVQASKIETYQFENAEQEKTYKVLIDELRCLVCQNQNLADSNAELAQDLRRKTYEMVSQGMDEKQVVEYMVARYGDFVLYKPPLQVNTLLLWVGPFIIFAAALVVLIRFVRRKPAVADTTLSDADRAKAEALLTAKEPD